MSYLDRNLLPGERIIFRTKKSLIIFFYPAVLALLSVFACDFMLNNPVLAILYWIPALVTVIFWAYVGLEYLTSEYAVTDKRVMMREGFFTRHANELRVASISQINVDQSLIAQILNYGTVSINAFGAYDSYPLISKPFTFQKSVNEQIDKQTTR